MIVGLSGGFWVFNISNPSQPQKIAEILHRGALRDMERSGSFLYCADYKKGFRIFDLSHLPEIEEIAQIGDRVYNRILIKDSLAFLAQMWGGVVPGWYDTLEIFSISDPRNPRRLGKIGFGGGSYVEDPWVEGNRLYVPARRGGLQIFDISNPENPLFLGGWQREESYVMSVCTQDTIAYVGIDLTDSLFIFNVKDPQNIRMISKIRVGQIDDPGTELGGVSDCVLKDTLLYLTVTANDSGGIVVNVKNPQAPSIIARVGRPGGECYLQVALSDTLLIFACAKGIYLYDVRNPGRPSFLSFCRLFSEFLTVRVLNDSLVNIGTYDDGHLIFDIRERPLVRLRGDYWPVIRDSFRAWYCGRSAVRDSLIYTGFHWPRRFYILNFSNPDSLSEVAVCSLSIQYPWEFRCNTCFLSDTLAFVAGAISFFVVNIKDPRNPREVGRLQLSSMGEFQSIFHQGNFVYAACEQDGFRIIDVSDPQNPFFRAHLPPVSWGADDVFVKDTVAFIAENFGGFRIVNVKNPDSVWEITRIPSSGCFQTLGVWVERNLAYVAWGLAGLRIFDISDISSPREVGYYQTAYPADKVEVNNGLIHLSASDDGYLCLQYYGPGIEEERKGEDLFFQVLPTIGKDFKILSNRTVSLKIYDAQGRLVKRLKEGEKSFSLSEKPTGVYFVVKKGKPPIRIVNLK
jgi:hypothetical protein